METASSVFSDIFSDAKPRLNPSELRVAQYISRNRHHALHASARELASKSQTSDATVVRTAKSLGFSGLGALRQALAAELEGGITPASRVARTVANISGDQDRAFGETLAQLQTSLADMNTNLPDGSYRELIAHILAARKVLIFGIGPTSAIASYFAIQLGRMGVTATTLSQTGLQLADELMQVQRGDLVLLMAYGHLYPEVTVTIERAQSVDARTILITDTLKDEVVGRVDLVLEIPRGKKDGFSMHTVTLAFLEAVLVGLASCTLEETIDNLKELNDLRAGLVQEKRR